MKLKNFLAQWEKDCDAFLGAKHNPQTGEVFTRDDILTGRDAWWVAHRVGICQRAYALPRWAGVNDAHIQTALEALFPKAVFCDPKRY